MQIGPGVGEACYFLERMSHFLIVLSSVRLGNKNSADFLGSLFTP